MAAATKKKIAVKSLKNRKQFVMCSLGVMGKKKHPLSG